MVAKVGERAGWFDRMAGNVPDLLIGRLGTRGIRILIPWGTPSTPHFQNADGWVFEMRLVMCNVWEWKDWISS
jgi:hypothetical protein